jgi:DNA repair protein RecO (recombination protein O)
VPAYPLRALVLRKTKLGEADLILHLLSEDGRIVRAVAKGMRKPSSRYAGRLEPGSVADLMLNTGRSLEIISDARSVDLHPALRDDYDRSTAASVALDVLDKMAVEGQTEERLFGLAQATLCALESAEGEAHIRAVVTAFLVKAMAMHGYRPHLESCVSCACESSVASGFSLEAGGVICPSCGVDSGPAPRLSPAARDLIRRLLGAKMADVATTDLPARPLAEAFALVRAFVGYHLPTRLKALDFYANGAGS